VETLKSKLGDGGNGVGGVGIEIGLETAWSAWSASCINRLLVYNIQFLGSYIMLTMLTIETTLTKERN
jgi:hypothetical protein